MVIGSTLNTEFAVVLRPTSTLFIALVLVVASFTCSDASKGPISFSRPELDVTLPETTLEGSKFHKLFVTKSQFLNGSVGIAISKIVDLEVNEDVTQRHLFSIDEVIGGTATVVLSSNDFQGRKKFSIQFKATFGATKIEVDQCKMLVRFITTEEFCDDGNKKLCFAHNFRLKVVENSSTSEYIDQVNYKVKLLHDICKVTSSPNYNIISRGGNVLEIDELGNIRLLKALNYEKRKKYEFEIKCTLKVNDRNQIKKVKGRIEVIDTNDSPPILQTDSVINIKSSDIAKDKSLIVRRVRERYRDDKKIFVYDFDSQEVNNYAIRIENDPNDFFMVKKEKIISSRDRMYIVTEVAQKKLFSFEGEVYSFDLVFEDTSYIAKGSNKARIRFNILEKLNESTPNNDVNFNPKGIYHREVDRSASKLARVFDDFKSTINIRDNFSFAIKSESAHGKGIFGVTSRTGIVYVLNPSELRKAAETLIQVRLRWKQKFRRISGIFTLMINVTDVTNGSSTQCKEKESCSMSNRKKCQSTCSVGTKFSTCLWRRNDAKSANELTTSYGTCVPDLEHCPNNHCDELELFQPSLCPQDCTKTVYGELVPGNRQRGIYRAVNRCICDISFNCICGRTHSKTSNSTTSFVTTKSLDKGSRQYNFNRTTKEETDDLHSEHVLTHPQYTGTSVEKCGTSCIIISCVGLLVVALLCFILWKTWCCKNIRLADKYENNNVMTMTAVPSDYVDDLSSSPPESTSQATAVALATHAEDFQQPLSHQPSSSSSSAIHPKFQVDPKWEFSRNRLTMLQTLGEGEFGKVMKARAFAITDAPIYTIVAVKMLKNNNSQEEMKDLLSELNLLKEVSHPNVIKLLGACTQKGGPLYMIVEYAEHGSLRSCLRNYRLTKSYGSENSAQYVIEESADHETELQILQFDNQDLLSFAWQTSKGMQYLSSLKLVHRDLAARNILVADGKTIKISDFGLSRDVYEADTYFKRSRSRVPVKWLALESLEDNLYTIKSDVWSFGIVLWEIVTLGASPYPGITPERLFHLLKSGYRMDRPENCSTDLYKLMMSCWSANPHLRPGFEELTEILDNMLQEGVEYIDLNKLLKMELLRPNTSSSTPPIVAERSDNPSTVEAEVSAQVDVTADRLYNGCHQSTVETYSLLPTNPKQRQPRFV